MPPWKTYTDMGGGGFIVPLVAHQHSPQHHPIIKHLACIEKTGFEPLPDHIFARYICGAAYCFLPEAFATRRKGVALLEALNRELDGITFAESGLPPWLAGPAWIFMNLTV